ncbi:MAG: hypothetical protein WBN92_04900 [Terriglobia bacterium]
MKYVRLYTDPAGESHFKDIEVELALVDYAPPAPPLNLSPFIPATQFAFLNAPAGWQGDWHPASARSVYFLLSGEWEVTASMARCGVSLLGTSCRWRRHGEKDTRAGSSAMAIHWQH